jgi:hypothetical protein
MTARHGSSPRRFEQGGPVADVLLAFERFIPASDMLAYLAMMAPRLGELRRTLKLLVRSTYTAIPRRAITSSSCLTPCLVPSGSWRKSFGNAARRIATRSRA